MHLIHLKVFLTYLAFAVLSACINTDTRIYHASRPVLVHVSEEYPHVIELQGVKLSVRCYNDIAITPEESRAVISDKSVGEIVPGDGLEEVFNVLLGYLPDKEGFILDSSQVYLEIDGERYQTSVKRRWLFEAQDKSVTGLHLGHYCGPYVAGFSIPIPSNHTQYKSTKYWHCYEMQFDLKPPNPSKEFAISVDGMKSNGEYYDLPAIHFEGYVRKEIKGMAGIGSVGIRVVEEEL